MGQPNPPIERAMFFENRSKRRLFGVLHKPNGPETSGLGLVFCHPLSWEKQYSYRAYAQFSRCLVRAGFASFRFDAFGFGDSEGDFCAASIRSQIADTQDAIELFRGFAGISKVVLVGIRFGATIAALTAEENAYIKGLVLHSPVIDGAAYQKELIRASRLARLAHGQRTRSKSALLAELDATGLIELDAELYSRALLSELQEIDLIRQVKSFAGACYLCGLASDAYGNEQLIALRRAYQARGASVKASLDEPREFWTSKSRYAGYLPLDWYDHTVDWLAGSAL